MRWREESGGKKVEGCVEGRKQKWVKDMKEEVEESEKDVVKWREKWREKIGRKCEGKGNKRWKTV